MPFFQVNFFMAKQTFVKPDNPHTPMRAGFSPTLKGSLKMLDLAITRPQPNGLGLVTVL